MSRDELYNKWKEFIDLGSKPDLVKYNDLSEALYSADNVNLTSYQFSETEAILCWKIIEALRNKELPKDLII